MIFNIGDSVAIPEGCKFEKIWENANVSTAYNSQTVNLPAIADYDFLWVQFVENDGTTRPSFVAVPTGSDSTIVNVNAMWNLGTTTTIYFVRRSANIYSNRIVFNDCQYKTGSAMTTTKTNNAYIVPYQVYGIKNAL